MSVIDTTANAVTATVGVGTQPSGVAVDSAAGAVFVTNSGAGSVSVLDPAANAVTDTVPAGSGPFEDAVDPSTHAAYVTNSVADQVTVISSADLRISLGRKGAFRSGQPARYRIVVANTGTGPTIAATSVQANLPAGLTPRPSGNPAWACTSAARTSGATGSRRCVPVTSPGSSSTSRSPRRPAARWRRP